jgi:hypothetical protein
LGAEPRVLNPQRSVLFARMQCDSFGGHSFRPINPPFLENLVMFQIRKAAIATVVSTMLATVGTPVATAQTAATDAATAASTPKQIQKAQRKAARKAARAKNNAELSTLEKNGYQPAGDQANYPQNIQAAEAKAAAAKAASSK